MKVSLEDEFEDVVNKAHTGLHADGEFPSLDTSDLMQSLCDQISEGQAPEEEIRKLAQALHLKQDALVALARQPEIEQLSLPDHLHTIVMPFGPYTVNVQVLIHRKSHQCLIFDAGTGAEEILTYLETSRLTPHSLLVTHGHRDHIAGIGRIKRAYPRIRIYAHSRTLYPGAIAANEGDAITFEDFTIRVYETFGHSQDSVSYLIQDHSTNTQAMIPGDTIFARSIGNIHSNYKASLDTIRTKILSQKPDTILLPGHGPATTVADELEYNPFFP